MYVSNQMMKKINFCSVILFCLSIIFITLGSTVPAQADDDFGIIFPESKSRLVDTDIEDESGSWGPDGPGGFFPGGIDNVNPPGAPDPDAGDPGSGHPGHSGDPNHPDYDDRSFWERLRDFGRDLWDGAVEAGRDLGELASDTWDYITDPDGLRADAASFGEWLLDGFVDAMSSVGEWFSDTMATAGEWFSEAWDGLSDWTQDLIVTIGIVLGVVAGIAVLVVVGLISIPVALVAAAGAAIAAGIYFLINGGTESFNWVHALGWTVGGAIAGGLLQATGGLAAGARALWGAAQSSWTWMRGAAQMMWLRNVHLAIIMPLRQHGLGFVLKSMSMGALKLFRAGAGLSLVFDGVRAVAEYLKYGETSLTIFESAINALTAGTAAVLTFGLARGFLHASVKGKIGLSLFSGGVFGTLEATRGYLLTGSFTWSNFMLGAIVGFLFPPVLGAIKEVTNFIIQIKYKDPLISLGVKGVLEFFDNSITSRFKSYIENKVNSNEQLKISEHQTIDRNLHKKYYEK